MEAPWERGVSVTISQMVKLRLREVEKVAETVRGPHEVQSWIYLAPKLLCFPLCDNVCLFSCLPGQEDRKLDC